MVEISFPGVFVEEVSFRAKSIEGVSTSTAGFVGPTRFGPFDVKPRIVTSLGDFESTYGDGKHLEFSDAGKMDNYLWHAARAFFEEGGKRLYISRVFKPANDDGIASATLQGNCGGDAIMIRARCPGEAGNRSVRFSLRIGQNILDTDENGRTRVSGLLVHDVVWIRGAFYQASFDHNLQTWLFSSSNNPSEGLQLNQLDPGDVIRRVTISVTFTSNDPPGSAEFERTPNALAEARSLPIVIDFGSRAMSGIEVLTTLFGSAPPSFADGDELKSAEVVLTGGNDGARPAASEYAASGLKVFEDIEDLSIVAAPGCTFGYESGFVADADAIIRLLIDHAQRMRYRIAVLDSGNGQSIAEVRAMRGKFDSTHAAFYFPWVRVLDPVTGENIHLPPSGFVAGIYGRTDSTRGVFKAPANEVVNLARGFETLVTKAQQDVLNSEGINCFRFFESRGFRLFGGRTISSDPEWKYVNIRRYFAYLEQSIDKDTQWVVFEPNGESLWDNVRRTIEDFLLQEWRGGGLMGDKPEEAFFVKCDRSTMTQNDLDNGRLVCVIGVAAVRPAEFVIFRIGQWTADHDDDD